MTYQEYKNKRQEEYNALPIWYAFGQQQFDEAMKAHGLNPEDTDKIYAFGGGGYYLRSDAEKIRAFFTEVDELYELMDDADFRKDAFRCEMDNHEYCINWQADWDVCRCFGHCEYSDCKGYIDYLTELGHPEWIPEYEAASRQHYK